MPQESLQNDRSAKIIGGAIKKLLLTFVIAITALSMDGYATPIGIPKNPPLLDLTSNKPSKLVAICVAEKWKSAELSGGGRLPNNMEIKQSGFVVTAIKYDSIVTWTGLIADIDDTPSGSTSKYYKSDLFDSKVFDEALKACQ